MRPIKFRGTSCDDYYPKGKNFAGNLSRFLGIKCPTITNIEFASEQGWNAVTVDPDSIRQLVGYDKDGKEVYEGDEVVSELGNVFRAELRPMVVQKTGFGENINLDVTKFKLKEATRNG